MRSYEVRRKLEGNEYMEIKVKYSEGSYMEQRGFYAYCTTIEIKDGFKRVVPMDERNFKFLIKGASRFSKKTMQKIVDYIDVNEDELFENYKNGKSVLVENSLKSLVEAPSK